VPRISGKSSWPPFDSDHEAGLLDRTDATGLTSTTLLPGTRVMTVATAVSRQHVRERRAIAIFVDVHAITDSCAELHRVCQDANDGTGGDIHHVVNGAASLREAGEVSRQEAETLLFSHWSWWNTGVQPQQISDRSTVIWATSRADRTRVLNQRQQVGAWFRGNRDAEYGSIQMRQKWIEKEVGELFVVLWIVHTEAVFEACPDDQLIDQRVALTVHLTPLALTVKFPVLSANRYTLTGGRSIGPDHGVLIAGGMKLAIHCQHGDGNFQHNRVHVETCHGVGSVVVRV